MPLGNEERCLRGGQSRKKSLPLPSEKRIGRGFDSLAHNFYKALIEIEPVLVGSNPAPSDLLPVDAQG